MTRTTSKPTLRTVAEHTGFAVATVSRALAGDPQIAQSTRDKIAKAADDIGYVPDRAAQRLRTGRTHVIALVLDPHGEIIDFSGSMISGFAEVIRDTRFHMTLTQYQLGEDPMRPIRHIVRNRLADGVVFARTEPRDPRVSFLLDAQFPFVTHGRTHFQGHAWLDYDNDAFARLAVARLAAKGRKHLFLIPPSPRYTFAQHMVTGFTEAARAHGVIAEMPEGFDLNTPSDEINRAIMARLRAGNAPDGWICAGEIAAIATNAAIHDAGLHLGRDVDIVAKQTSKVFDLYRPRIDTIYEDITASGRGMARALLAQIEGKPGGECQTLLAPEPNF